MSTLICGSIAFDSIMVFHDRFRNHILPEQIHILNVSFLVPEMRREFGGCAGNIAYSLALLGQPPRLFAFSPADVCGQRDKIETARSERSNIRRAPERRFRQIFKAFLLTWFIGFGSKAVKDQRAFVVQVSNSFAVAARVGNHVRINGTPIWPQNFQHAPQIRQVVAQFDNANQIELAQNFRNVMNGSNRAFFLPELSDVPGSDVDGFVQFRRWNFGGGDSLFESKQSLGDLR